MLKILKSISKSPHFFRFEGFSVKITWSCIFLFSICFAPIVQAQKFSSKRWQAKQFTEVVIEGEVASTIYLKSAKTDSVVVSVELDGETYENMMPAIQENDSVLHLTLEYRPYFERTDDKLAAHKVLSGEWYVLVPEIYEVTIKSTMASVQFKGSYKNLNIQLEQGWCYGKRFLGNAFIQTKHGGIHISASPEVHAEATSWEGNVSNSLTSQGKYKMKVESKYGNIVLQKTQ